MKKKKIILLMIVIFPSAFWLILELSTINSKKLPFFGPKSLSGTDTLYYRISNSQLNENELNDTVRFPLYAICFTKKEYAKDLYRMGGLVEYLKYKKENIEHVPIFVAIANEEDSLKQDTVNVKRDLKLINENLYQIYYPAKDSLKILNENYFKDKPYYVFNSFIVLVDVKRHIRGYYDGRYVSEVKRLIEEYKHLRLKEEKKILINENKIEDKKQKQK